MPMLTHGLACMHPSLEWCHTNECLSVHRCVLVAHATNDDDLVEVEQLAKSASGGSFPPVQSSRGHLLLVYDHIDLASL